MKKREYQRNSVVEYAKKWAYRRNPDYYNYDSIGGDCTNFVSQCIYAGSKVMNYNKYGWYYINSNDKSASWTGVEFLHEFLVTNKGVGPFGKEVEIEDIEIGDIAQLSFDGKNFSHSLLIIDKEEIPNINTTLVATHTFDSFGRSISSYNFVKIRYINIEAIRI